MTESSLHYKVREHLSQLSSTEKQSVSRDELLNGDRLKAARHLELKDYELGCAFRREAPHSHEASVDLSLGSLPLAPVDVPAWRHVIATRENCFHSLVALIEPALREGDLFPAVNKLLPRNSYLPADDRIRRSISNLVRNLDEVPNRELRRLLVEREIRQQSNRSLISALVPELKQEILQGLSSLQSQLKLRTLDLPLGDIQKRLDAVHLEVFDPLLSKSHSDIAFCSCFSHSIFVSDDLCPDDYKPILRHELLHAASGLAPTIAQLVGAERGADPLTAAINESFSWERYGLSAYDGKLDSHTWLNEGVTEFLNQVIAQKPNHTEVSINGWSRMAGVIAKIAERVDISPLLNTYFSDAPLKDPSLITNKKVLEASLGRVYGPSILEELDSAWVSHRGQDAVCDVYDERFSRLSWRERVGSFFGSVASVLSARDSAAAQ